MDAEDEKNEKPRGFLSFSKCPDCKWKVSRLVRAGAICAHDGKMPILAACCENVHCWRFTDLNNIPSWKRII